MAFFSFSRFGLESQRDVISCFFQNYNLLLVDNLQNYGLQQESASAPVRPARLMMRGRLSLCSVGLMLLCLSLGSSLNEWDTASGKVFNEAYSPYEQCVLTLTPAIYNVSATVFDQTKCVHLIDAFLLKLPKRCWLGGLHQPHDLGVCIGSRMTGAVLKEKKCVYLTDRQSMWKSWVGGKGDVDASQTRSEIPSGTLNHAVRYLEEAGSASDLLKVGVSNNFEVIAMAGTFVIQFAFFSLICDWRTKFLFIIVVCN